jgi:hypothetical protein
MNNKTEPAPKDLRRAFSDLLEAHRNGDAQLDASEALTKLIAEVRDTCRAGEISVKIKFQPSNGGKILAVTDEIVVKHPKKDKEADIWFSTQDGGLSKNNPEQMRLPLREVADTSEIKNVPAEPDRPLRVVGAV